MDERVSASVADRGSPPPSSARSAPPLLLAGVRDLRCAFARVARRMHEIGIRMALGADALAVVRMVRSSALKPVAVGILIGAIGVLAAGQLIASML